MPDLKHLKTVIPAENVLQRPKQQEKQAQRLGVTLGIRLSIYGGLWQQKEIKLGDEINVYRFLLNKFFSSLEVGGSEYKKLRLSESDLANVNELLKKLIRNTIQRIDQREDEFGEIGDFTSFTLRFCVDLCLYCCDKHDEESVAEWFNQNFPEINSDFSQFLEDIYRDYSITEDKIRPKYQKLPIHLKQVGVVDGFEIDIIGIRTTHTRLVNGGLTMVPYSTYTEIDTKSKDRPGQLNQTNTTSSGLNLLTDEPLTVESVLESNSEALDKIENYIKSKYPELVVVFQEMEEKVILERMQGFVDLIEKNDLLNFYKDEEIPQIFEARNKNLENIVNTLSILDLLKGRSIIVNWILLFMVGTDFNAIISTFTNSKYYKSDEFQYSIKAIKLIESITKKYYHMKYDDLEIFARFLGDLKVSLDTLDIILPNATVSDSKAGQGFGGSKAKGEGLETYIRALNEQLAFMEKYLDPERLLYPKLAKSLLEIYNTIDKFSGRGFGLGKFNLSFKISRFNDAPQEIFLELQLQIKMLLDLLMSNNCGLDDTTKALILSASNNLSNNVENKNSDQCVEFLENILKLTKNLGKVISNYNEDLIFLQNGGAELTFDNLSTAKIIIYIKDLCEKLTEKQIE